MLDILRQKIIEVAATRGYVVAPSSSNHDQLQIGHCIAVLGRISSGDRAVVMEQIDGLLNIVLEIRKTSKAVTAGDIYLMLVGDFGTADNSAMEAIAAEIERDDRLARKYVWLPDLAASDFSKFIDRTFLATPWETPDGSMSSLSLLSKDIEMPDGWEEVLLDPALESTELVKTLIQLESYP